jgi:putative transposase
VHAGRAPAVVAARQQTLDGAYAAHLERLVRGRPAPPMAPEAAWITPLVPHGVAAARAETDVP